MAEDVRLYSQQTWRVVTQTRGVQLVEQHIHKVVSFRAWNTNMDKLAKSMIFLQHKLLVEILITHARAHTHTGEQGVSETVRETTGECIVVVFP